MPGRDEDRPRKGHDADENPNVVESKRNIKLKIEGGPALTYAYLSMRGYYPNDPNKPNQDNFCIKERFAGAQNRALFSVFDGHGSVGHECATFARDHLSKNLSAIAASVGDKADLSVDKATKAHVKTNTAMRSSSVDDGMSGTTAVSVLFNGHQLQIMNLGDSRAIYAYEGGSSDHKTKRILAKALSYDQTPYRKDERERCKAAGARILTMDQLDGIEPIHENFETALGDELDEQGDPPRVWLPDSNSPGCAFTRSFGDAEGERVGVCAEPEITNHTIQATDRLVVLASDGVFEFLTNQQVIDLIAEYPGEPLTACRKVVSEAYQAWLQYEMRTDDITIIIIEVDADEAPLATADEEAKDAAHEHGRRPSALNAVRVDEDALSLKPVRRPTAKNKLLLAEEGADGETITEAEPAKSAAEKASIVSAVRGMFLFNGLSPSQLDLLARATLCLEFNAGDVVVSQGTEGDNMYIVQDGHLDVFVKSPGAEPDVVERYGRKVHQYHGSTAEATHPYFGELALQTSGALRQASIVARTDCKLWAITRRVFRKVLARMATREELVATLRRVETLSKLPATQLQHLADVVSDAKFAQGELVISEGEIGDAMFVLHEGTASATRMIDGALTRLKDYGPGDYFGERALVTNEPRAANILATSNLKCYRIERYANQARALSIARGR